MYPEVLTVISQIPDPKQSETVLFNDKPKWKFKSDGDAFIVI